jgi:hypothetical protein
MLLGFAGVSLEIPWSPLVFGALSEMPLVNVIVIANGDYLELPWFGFFEQNANRIVRANGEIALSASHSFEIQGFCGGIFDEQLKRRNSILSVR